MGGPDLSVQAISSFMRAVYRVAYYVRDIRQRRSRTFKKLADRKFRELEATHKRFIGLLRDLGKAGKRAENALGKSNAIGQIQVRLLLAILKMEEARGDGQE